VAVSESGHLAARELDDLYRANGADVYRYAFAVLGNHADAEDVTQTTFLNAYRALEQGVRPGKPANWLLTIASNAIKQRFRQERARPRQVELDDSIAGTPPDDDGPSVGELLTALSRIPPQQRQAIVLREFEGRSYSEITEILGVTKSALETLLFRARRSLAEELQHQLTCTDAQLAISRSVDGRLGRRERRRLRDHLAECPDCVRFVRLQQRHRSALRGLALVPIPLSLTLVKGLEGSASAAVVPIGTSVAAGGVAAGGVAAVGASAAGTTGGLVGGGVAMKTAAVVAAASVAGGVGVAGSTEVDPKPQKPGEAMAQNAQEHVGRVAPRGVHFPGNGVALGRATAPGRTKKQPGGGVTTTTPAKSRNTGRGNSAAALTRARGQTVSAAKRQAAQATRASKPRARLAKTTGKAKERRGAAAMKPKARAASGSDRRDASRAETNKTMKTKKTTPASKARAANTPKAIPKAGAAATNGKARGKTSS
jgi:RNA polymerase sigma factor (sigma-70 family)